MATNTTRTIAAKAWLLTGVACGLAMSVQAQGAITAPAIGPLRAVTPLRGDLDPFKGDIDPFKGDLNPFKGDLDPFKGDLNPFWGDVAPLVRDVNPFDGRLDWNGISDFWNRATTSWAETSKLWASPEVASGDPRALATLNDRITQLVAEADRTWGTAVRTRTGKAFADGFANPVLARNGIDPANPASLTKLSAGARARFFLEWYDGLMSYSGADRFDHWMRTVNWSPALTQQQGGGADTVIGLLDGDARGGSGLANNIVSYAGYGSLVGGHGAGVASLMVAPHDGQGVMGIAPRARVVAYNPFDDSSTASWADVSSGIANLRGKGASIINASLGVSGWTLAADWVPVFGAARAVADTTQSVTVSGVTANTSLTSTSVSTSTTTTTTRSTTTTAGTSATASTSTTTSAPPITPVFVLAAGNSGTTQTQNVAWDGANDPALLVVGSVDPTGTISSFSNRPGTACLTIGGVCRAGNRLMDRFIVAPGELILVSDGADGVVRRSGTSFAAPLVSGAIALLHDRWPWLASYPKETVSIIVASARDLGAPGVDATYGVGLLDVERSQSPIDFAKLDFYQVKNGQTTAIAAPQMLTTGVQPSWDADGVYFTLYERIGSTYRDFEVPMSSRLVGTVTSWQGKAEQFQRYLTKQLNSWIVSGGTKRFSDVANYSVAGPGGLRLTLSGSQPSWSPSLNRLTAHSTVALATPDGRFSLTAGSGYGALAVGGQPGFERSDDYASGGGGANPLLGFASGGAFARGAVKLGSGEVAFGVTGQRLDHARSGIYSEAERRALRGLDAYRAGAVNLHLTQHPAAALTVTFDYARVREANGLLGVQSTLADDLGSGATTHAYSLGAALDLGRSLSLAVTGTQGRTTVASGQLLASPRAVRTSAYAVALQKGGVFGRNDMLRATLSQPLHIDQGELRATSVDVINRLTGELGEVQHAFAIDGRKRQYLGELMYATTLVEGAGELGLFAKGDLRAAEGSTPGFVLGSRLNLRF